jgi:hypothetical protein
MAQVRKILKTIDAGYIGNAYFNGVVDEMISEGWGIDAMVDDPKRNTWITFYRYENPSECSEIRAETKIIWQDDNL